MSEKLLPCPFCGGTRLMVTDSPCPYHEGGRAYAVSCTTRDCHGAIYALGYDLFRTPDEAVAAWNKRAPSERQAIVDWLLSMKRDDTNWPQHLAKRIERGEYLEAPSHE